jgi:hypothetical protein
LNNALIFKQINNNKFQFDLVGYCINRLSNHGIGYNNIADVLVNTYDNVTDYLITDNITPLKFIDEQLSKISEYIKNEKEVLLKAYEQDEKNYLDMVDNLTTRLNSLEKENAELKNKSMKKTSPLNNKKVLVVGDTGRKEGYKQIVEQYGGHFDFVDGIFEKDKLSVVSESADVAILIVPRIKHTVSHILKANKVPVIFVNSAGIGAFEDVVDKYCS